ncbi:MAG: trimethylamine methyltransferase family protein [Bacillota bacterium]|nr:trimethylamine methyltransferase family protein [Bacillota bacterium]MDW7728501.1 trimethylamine methyltransferase family protein [Bacillota bacterium]
MIFEPLTADDLQLMHDQTLKILAETGAIVEGKEAREILLSAGCQDDGKRLRFPSKLVEECLTDPEKVTLYGVDENIVLPLTDSPRTYAHNFGSVSMLLDHKDDIIREALAEDLVAYIRISDMLPNLHMVVPSLRPTDLPEEIASLAMTAYALQNTVKPVDIGTASDTWEIRFLVRIASAVRGSLEKLIEKPMGTLSISPLSPLNFPADITDAIIESARTGLPITMLPCPTRGLTAPVTLAGGLVQQNAEQLAFITLARLVNRHTPLVYTCRLAAANMRSGCVSGRDPDLGFSGACVAQIARFYGLPSGVYGMDTGSAVPDIQSGYERALNALYPSMARATFVSGMGSLNAGLLASAEQLVIDNEIYGMVFHRQQGINVSEEAIGAEVIKAVMDGGNYLAQEHTRNYMRKGELFTGRLGNESPFEEWRSSGRQTIREEAKGKIDQILAEHPGIVVDTEISSKIMSLLEEAKEEKQN